jgi:SAM-dependent methyltransferase
MKWHFPRIAGPFGFQPNSSTRAFEYPWAFSVLPVEPGLEVIDLGGGLAGFQFALAKSGAHVRNVDPGEEASGRGWPVDVESIERLNRSFHTHVELVSGTLDKAALPTDSVDAVYSISTLEHIPPDELPALMREIARILKPGGSCVLTVDLFLNLQPFSDRTTNEFGHNVAPKDLAAWSTLPLVEGDRSELLGFAEFDHREIMGGLERYLLGEYPVLAQCFVLRKPAAAPMARGSR